MKFKALFFILLLLAAIGGGLLVFRHIPREAGGPAVLPTLSPTPSPKPVITTIKVYVSGGVRRPGIYTLSRGSRVIDALLLAGGTIPGADLGRVRMAMKLKDGATVNVPAGKAKAQPGKNPVPAVKKKSKVRTGTHPRVMRQGEKIFINTASEENLMRLPGIGPALARKIREYRDSCGGFDSLEEVKSVPGLSPKKFDKIKGFIEL